MYLNELDQFVKHKLKAKYYIRYVDDFVILHHNQQVLSSYKEQITKFLNKNLLLILHPDKSVIKPLARGISFLGFRTFYYHKLLMQKNKRKFFNKFVKMEEAYDLKKIDYDQIYDFLEGWNAYAKYAQTYNLRKSIMKMVENKYPIEVSTKEINRTSKDSLLCQSQNFFPERFI